MADEPVILVRITSPHFVAGLAAIDGRVALYAPILKYMNGWTGKEVAAYCQKKGWTWERVKTS